MITVILRITDDGVVAVPVALHQGVNCEGGREVDIGHAPSLGEDGIGDGLVDTLGGVGARSVHDVLVVPLVGQNPGGGIAESHVLALADDGGQYITGGGSPERRAGSAVGVIRSALVMGQVSPSGVIQ